mmetsp:Transcript_61106/g.51704  ORF Transcript_61106/g.51704 Transcript_61106/m.51704 type:complete len:102 (-) Transcript_61106:92-397(-)
MPCSERSIPASLWVMPCGLSLGQTKSSALSSVNGWPGPTHAALGTARQRAVYDQGSSAPVAPARRTQETLPKSLELGGRRPRAFLAREERAVARGGARSRL